MRREIKLETFLANLPLFRGLGTDALARLAAGAKRLRLSRGEALFREGEPPEGFYAVVYGEIRLSRGAGRLVDLIGPGKTFGEPVMFLAKPYLVGASAAKDSLVVRVSKDAVDAEIDRNPRFAHRVIASLARRSEVLMREIDSYALGSAAERLVAYLLRREPRDASGTRDLTLPMAKRALASRLNLSAEHLSRIFGELSDKGLIEVRGRRLHVPDLARLRAYRAARSRARQSRAGEPRPLSSARKACASR